MQTGHYNLAFVENTTAKQYPNRPDGMSMEEFLKYWPEPLPVFYQPMVDVEALWGGKWALPAIGDRVHIVMNGLGNGTVESYFIEGDKDHWLGVTVRLDKQPEWHRKQNGNRPIALVFGTEIEPLPKPKICPKCNQVMVRLEDGTYDCGCPLVDPDPEYPSLATEAC